MFPRTRGTVPGVIRPLAPAELVWFLSRALAFQGHPDPMGLAARLGPRLRQARRDAEHTFVWQRGRDAPTAGAHLRAPGPDDEDRTIRISPLWHEGDDDEARSFLEELLGRTPHEAVVVPLRGLSEAGQGAYRRLLEPAGFREHERVRLRFHLADVPPLGTPLALEAWSDATDAEHRDVYRRAEGVPAGEKRWAWLKRRGGRFRPDLWFLLRPAPDQEPVGYAFCHGDDRLDGRYRLEAAGVLPEHRDSTVMLRRLVVTTLLELAARSPMATVETQPSASDPKLVEILHSIGFEAVGREVRLERLPE